MQQRECKTSKLCEDLTKQIFEEEASVTRLIGINQKGVKDVNNSTPNVPNDSKVPSASNNIPISNNLFLSAEDSDNQSDSGNAPDVDNNLDSDNNSDIYNS